MDRAAQLARLRDTPAFDIVVIGGGATGCGVALDAAARGFRVALIEANDFAKGTSSRATKLVHGGVRYLAQGNVGLVREALYERSLLLDNAPHLAQPVAFVMPSYRWWERGFYGIGLKMYDALAGRRGLGDTQFLSASQTMALLPTLRRDGLTGGVKYWDGQFDDARLALAIARTAESQGACVVNHCAVTGLVREDGKVRGLRAEDGESGETFMLRAGCVVNATGVWVDSIREMDADAGAPRRAPIVAPSQGVHLVVDRAFLPTDHALLIPKTQDGRVLFAVPWMGMTVLGTTDTPSDDIAPEPVPFRSEVEFILGEAAGCLSRAPTRADVRSVWVGLRPLVRPSDDDGADTKGISREHTVIVGRSGLVTVTGGKWTTYRAMAEDVLERCAHAGLIEARPASATAYLPLVGAPKRSSESLSQPPGEHLYGTEVERLRALPGADRWLWPVGGGGLSEAMVRFAARYEMARTVEDVLARRCRLLFLDAARAASLADEVARLLRDELGEGFDAAASAASFEALAAHYLTLP
ncbi:glycerol-3-phosphate dehydrogenase/oxidase [Piscinibacter sp. XHJ-5]|uniref:glycerol-3-phosphate dehydrogenase/oxidase n=1 Tax=Piscinibacter sp. XHJ-5 TaxID=3037797 RepID=UPI002452DC6D|nr:glycerol-3-phosphate dehydrogenase/oxidase [Piscinibacter sp. XHJ-5]